MTTYIPMKMWNLEPHQSAIVTGLKLQDKAAQARLKDLGVREGQSISCLQWTPFGGPRAYKLDNGIFALDKELAEAIVVNLEF